jgi:MFS family permease
MASSYVHTLRLFSRDIRLYLISFALFAFTIFGGIYTVLLNLYLLRLGYGPEFIGLVNAVGLLALALFFLPAGAITRRWGLRRAMIAGLCMAIIGDGALPLAESLPAAIRPGWLLATYLLAGLGTSLYVVNVGPFLVAATSPTERNHAFSVQAAIWPLAGFAGSLVGGLLPGLFAALLRVAPDHPAAYRYPLLLAAALLIPAVPIVMAMRDVGAEDAQTIRPKATPLPLGLIVLLSLIMLLQVSGEGAARTFLNVYLDDALRIPTPQIGALLAVGQLLAVPAALLMPLLTARWGNGRTFIIGALGTGLVLLPLALIPHWIAAGISFMGVIALASITRPTINVYMMEIIAPDWRVMIASATGMAAGLSWAAIALGGGRIIAALGYRSLFLLGIGLTIIGALLFWAYFRTAHSARALPGPAEQTVLDKI